MISFIKVLYIACILSPVSALANSLWHPVADGAVSKNGTSVAPSAKQAAYLLDEKALHHLLSALPYEPSNAGTVQLPLPDGTMTNFKVWRTRVLPDQLAAKYPGLSTYNAVATGAPTITAKLDISAYGFHAMVFNGDNTYLIDRADDTGGATYLLHYKKDERREQAQLMHCMVPGHEHADVATIERSKQVYRTSNGYQLRTYRMALSCDHQYARAATGTSNPTKAETLSKMVTTLNRINGVYERELSVTFTLVPNEDTLIFTDSLTDPFATHDQFPSLLISDNQTVCDGLIGSANYDVGHIFSTGGGGLSQLACVCQESMKAQSVTGSAHPTGDGFDIDYVAHEIGHELGANHTFNNNIDGSCSGNAVEEFAFQPGSGSTVMDYAGICNPDDLQPHSDAYFSGSSLLQIYQCITSTGDVCAVKTSTGNKPAGMPAYTTSYTIPFLTPFELIAPAATDSVADTSITYCWEQWNLGDFGFALKNTFYSGPIFRSFSPDTNTTRVFPNMAMVLADSLSNAGTEKAEGEKAPDVARFLTFRLTVRDIFNGYGSFLLPDDTLHLDVLNTGTGFKVTSQGYDNIVYIGTTTENVTWDMAQTNVAPINCGNVDIYLSDDGGKTWAYNLGSYANTGSATVLLPNVSTQKARIKVKGSGNVFFNVNRSDFTLAYYPGHSGDVILFPNPAHNVLHVLTGLSGTAEAGIYDILGKRVWEGVITDILELDVSDYPRGMYFLRTHGSDNTNSVKKFVVR